MAFGWAWDLLAMLLAGGSFWIICMFSLRYHFLQLDLEIRRSLKLRDINKTINLIYHHKQMEIETYWLNKEFRVHFYVVYKFLKPVLNLIIFHTHAPDMTTMMRIMCVIMAVITGCLKFMISYIASSVMLAAHRPQSGLYVSLVNIDSKMSLKKKLKIERFIERLSGPEIGFYCYDLFPINTYHFFDYLLDSIASYFLLINLLRGMGIV